MFQPTKGMRKFSAFDTHLNGRKSPYSTRMSTSEAWFATSTAGPVQGSFPRPTTRQLQNGFAQT